MVHHQGHFKSKKEKGWHPSSRIPPQFLLKISRAVFCKAESSVFLQFPCRENVNLLIVAYATCVLLCLVQLLLYVCLCCSINMVKYGLCSVCYIITDLVLLLRVNSQRDFCEKGQREAVCVKMATYLFWECFCEFVCLFVVCFNPP